MDMIKLFQDESGESAFSADSIFRHFLVTILSIPASDAPKLKSILKHKIGLLIKKGWPRDKEPKAYEVNKDIRFGRATICDILKTLAEIPTLRINYIVVDKTKITNQSFISAPYGIVYNYFTGVLLSEMVFEDNLNNIHLTYDIRNKETHNKRRFTEYLQTKIYGMALEKRIHVDMFITGDCSHKCYGLLAVDYFCWAIFRKFERADDSFVELFKNKVGRRQEWYI